MRYLRRYSSRSFFRQRQTDEFGNGAATASGDDDELAAVHHIRHRKAGFISGQLHFENGASRFLIQSAKFAAAALWTGREQASAVAGKQECFRHKQRSALGIAGTAQVNSRKSRMV